MFDIDLPGVEPCREACGGEPSVADCTAQRADPRRTSVSFVTVTF